MLNFADRMQNQPDLKGKEFLGEVVAVDTTGQGRFKAKVPGLYEDGDLPWIGFPRSSTFGNGKNFGFFGSPQIGSQAVITLQGGDPSYPLCEGFIARLEDIPERFRSPDVWGWQDPSGSFLAINFKTLNINFEHASGVKLHIDPQGKVSLECANLLAEVSNNTKYQTPDFEITGNLKVGGNVNIDKNTHIEGGLGVVGESEYNGIMKARNINVTEGLTITSQDYKDHQHYDSHNERTSGVID